MNEAAEIAELASSGLFDPGWYVGAYPDVAAAGLGSLDHLPRHDAEIEADIA